MELRERNPLTLTFAGAGFYWLGIMLWLALTDYVTRPNFPPAIGVHETAARWTPCSAKVVGEDVTYAAATLWTPRARSLMSTTNK